MKIRILAVLFTAFFVLNACSSSTSAETDIKELENSSNSQDVSSSSAGKKANGKTGNDIDVADIIEGISQGSLKPEQQKALKDLQEKIGTLSGDSDFTKNCEDGTVKVSSVMEQEVVYTCWSGIWMPTSGFDKVLESLPQESLEMVANLVGVPAEELMELVEFFSNLDLADSKVDVTCEGNVEDDSWKLFGNGAISGSAVTLDGTVTFSGDSMTTVIHEEMDLESEKACTFLLSAPDEEDEDNEDELAEEEKATRLHGEKTDEDEHCDGGKWVYSETRVKKNVSSEERSAAYADLIGKCKDYRDGKITIDEFLE